MDYRKFSCSTGRQDFFRAKSVHAIANRQRARVNHVCRLVAGEGGQVFERKMDRRDLFCFPNFTVSGDGKLSKALPLWTLELELELGHIKPNGFVY